MAKRIKYIDRLKGGAILLVIMGHINVFPLHGAADSMSTCIVSFHLPLFMFLSGFVIKPITKKFINVLHKKLYGLLIPFTVFGLSFTMYLSGEDSLFDLQNVLERFMLSGSKMGYWYLFVLALFYITMPLYAINKKERWWADVLIGVGVETVFLFGLYRDGDCANLMSLLSASCLYPFFIMGYMSRKYNIVKWITQNGNHLFTISFITFLFLLAFPPQNHKIATISWYIVQPSCAIFICLYVFAIREQFTTFLENQLEFIGKHTLDIYVLQYFIVASLDLSMIGDWITNSNNQLMASILAFAISVPTAYACIYSGKLIRLSYVLRIAVFGELYKNDAK